MQRDTRLIVLPGRRNNINVIVGRMPQRKNSIRPLRKLIPDSLQSADQIKKTIIFVDSIKSACRIAHRLRKRLQTVLPTADPEHIVADPGQVIRSYFL